MNRVSISGIVERQPTLRHKKNGASVTNILLKVRERIFNYREQSYYERISYQDCCAFGRIAEEICEEVCEGDAIEIFGPIVNSEREVEGVSVTKTQIQIIDFDLPMRWIEADEAELDERARTLPHSDEEEEARN